MTRHKIRLQFDFPQETIARIDVMRKRLDAGSRAEVVRRALKLLGMINDENEVIFRDAKGVERIIKLI